MSYTMRKILSRVIPSKTGMGDATPLFPIGCPRSGTTILAKALNSHPAMLVTNETSVFLQLYFNITQSRVGADAGIYYGKEYGWLWADHLNLKAKALIESYYERIRQYEGKGRLLYWGDKHPHHCDCMDFLAALYPDARYIYIARDPRDIACSLSQVLNTDIADSLRLCGTVLNQYAPFLQRMDESALLCIRYEDLVADYEGTLKRVLDWLGIDFAPETRSFLHKHSSVNAHSLWMPESNYTHVDFAAQSVGRWRREFSEADRLLAEELAGEFIRQYGY